MADPTTERQLAGITSIFNSGMQVRLAIEVVGLDSILKELQRMAKTLDDVLADTKAQTTVITSVVTLLTGLSQQLKDALASGDPAKVQAAADAIEANTTALAKAVTDNTPAPGPVPTPGPTPTPAP